MLAQLFLLVTVARFRRLVSKSFSLFSFKLSLTGLDKNHDNIRCVETPRLLQQQYHIHTLPHPIPLETFNLAPSAKTHPPPFLPEWVVFCGCTWWKKRLLNVREKRMVEWRTMLRLSVVKCVWCHDGNKGVLHICVLLMLFFETETIDYIRAYNPLHYLTLTL